MLIFCLLQGLTTLNFTLATPDKQLHFISNVWVSNSLPTQDPKQGYATHASYVLQQNKIKIVLTTALTSSEISEHVNVHGDGVKVLALTVDDARKSFAETVKRGAEAVQEPLVLDDNFGQVVVSSIRTYGETIHTFVERKNYRGAFMPGYQPRSSAAQIRPIGLQYVDHCVGNVELGQMNKWVKFYEDVMGFKLLITFDDKDISTAYSALMSKVVSNGNGYVKFPINEPAQGKKKSQIEEYLQFYHGPGVQHIALATDDIVFTVRELRDRGIEFLHVPATYYDEALARVGTIQEDIDELRELNVLIDRDEEGYLLQIFTKPIQDRPTLFFEIIERNGAKSFGKGNFKALFESIEREQALRGNL